ELAYLDTLAAVDGLAARKAALDERLSRLALEGNWWPTVARLRCFRGIDTLSAFVLCLEVGDWTRFPRPDKLAGWLGLVLWLEQSGESCHQGGSPRPAPATRAGCWSRPPGTTCEPRIGATLRNRRQGQPAQLQIAWRAQHRIHRQYAGL